MGLFRPLALLRGKASGPILLLQTLLQDPPTDLQLRTAAAGEAAATLLPEREYAAMDRAVRACLLPSPSHLSLLPRARFRPRRRRGWWESPVC